MDKNTFLRVLKVGNRLPGLGNRLHQEKQLSGEKLTLVIVELKLVYFFVIK